MGSVGEHGLGLRVSGHTYQYEGHPTEQYGSA